MKTNFKKLGLPAAACLALISCGEPDLKTALRSEGAPEVVSVIVQDNDFSLVASFCKAGDELAPYFYCADELTGTEAIRPDSPQVIVVFDELLDPNVEELIPIGDDGAFAGSLANTQPVTFTCGDGNTSIGYDGFYVPNGNAFTTPPGPALVINPEPLPAGAECQLTLKNTIKDKQGVVVTDVSPFTLKVAPLLFEGSDPEAEDEAVAVAPETSFLLYFNTAIDTTSISPTEITLTGPGNVPVLFTLSQADGAVTVDPAVDLVAGTYTLTLAAGASFNDTLGGSGTVDEEYVLTVVVE